ncbi:hypothetical protein RIF29_15814 [Crotalaria pallida]|uniref:Uncharacterized protein n=1 Tax=Crotalaria pallida TaxID=3830 RepID=A0AAN9ICX8_CROPI
MYEKGQYGNSDYFCLDIPYPTTKTKALHITPSKFPTIERRISLYFLSFFFSFLKKQNFPTPQPPLSLLNA